MSGMSIGRSHPRPCSGDKTLRRCKNSEARDNVILIDVDTDCLDNVVIIDVPESLSKKETPNSNMHTNVIYIDDEENSDPDPYFAVNNASSSAFEKSEYVQEISRPVRLSKCTSPNSGKGSERNHYGLSPDSESDLSDDDDCPDCELVEDSSGKVQEQWEKASSRRKKDFRVGRDDTRAFDFSVEDSESESGSSDRRADENCASSAFSKELDMEFRATSPVFEGSSKVEPKYKPCVDEDWCSGESNPLEDETTVGTSNILFETDVYSSRSFSRDTFDAWERELLETHATGKSSSENTLGEGKSTQCTEHEENEVGRTRVHSENGETSPDDVICIINEREKLKETDEYKRAMEEEWASRQQALRIQAEEAQHFRQLQKRRKSESLRLLDMEKRLKQRVEEVRNMQKKDEENMNLKEIIRSEIRNDLKKLEGSCHSMASLLHLLGIHVGGWPCPLPNEVQRAYKRALLTFHPDRASQSDIRQQVEAEEKFKLINRFKENFSPL